MAKCATGRRINRSASFRLRVLRWIACFAVAPALWACTDRRLTPPATGTLQATTLVVPTSPNRDIDILFMVDDSLSMQPLQQKLAQRLPDFMNVLKGVPGGLPDVHVAVVSSSLGAGIYGDVSGCAPGHPGNDGGKFQHAGNCGLNPGETYLKSIGGTNNFTGNVEDVFSCIALLGGGGCGFEHQFASTTAALQKAGDPLDPDNGGFLRPNAYLAIVMLTNEDDCSAPPDSTMFDPGQTSVKSPLGGLQSYRCNEFGHLCDGRSPPHDVTGTMTLGNCVSAENRGRLTTVADFISFLKGLKADPNRILVAALAGLPTPYVVQPQAFQLPDGSSEIQPAVGHSCTAANGDYADPAVRVKSWIDGFNGNGVFESICADDFRPAMVRIAQAVIRRFPVQCINGQVRVNSDGTPDCRVTHRTFSKEGTAADHDTPFCNTALTGLPCWRLTADPANCAAGQRIQVCWDPSCDPIKAPTDAGNDIISCSVTANP